MAPKKKGRPTLSKKLKKVNFGFTASPTLAPKLNKIRGSKSPFIGAVLSAIPEELIKQYNSDPEKFLSEVQTCTFALQR